MVETLSKEGNRYDRKDFTGKPQKINPENRPIHYIQADVDAIVTMFKDLTKDEASELYHQKTGILIPSYTIARILRHQNWTRKKTLKSAEQDSQRVQERRADFEKIQKTLSIQNVVCMDETGFKRNMTSRYGWSPRGLF